MINFMSFPGSSAVEVSKASVLDESLKYTSTIVVDEIGLYEDLNIRLMELEKALDIDVEALQSIIDDTSKMMIRWGEKNELLLRINWLERLLKVQQEINNVTTYKQADELRIYISSCQTSPLKKQLQERLDDLLEALPQESIEKTDIEQLMDFAIENVGDDFINLGKSGREEVINRLYTQFGVNVPVNKIQDEVIALEEKVARLVKVEDVQILRDQLETLPLSNYPRLSSERKQVVTEQLMESRQWKGLASLDRLIHQLDAKQRVAEEQKDLQIMESGFVTDLDFNHVKDLISQKH
ncbi:hypothetical protein [Savagea faecisuis]|uniref:Uncharacterized protein n=1 Tax=Savagea faecisuis TaxID=1274803 RepID=A0ABW3GWT2_9BACL